MFLKAKYGLILALISAGVFAQGLPFDSTYYGNNIQKIILECTPTVNDTPLVNGDYIVILKNSVIKGYTRWENSQNDTIYVYDSTNVSDSSLQNSFSVRIYSSSNNYCIVNADVLEIERDSGYFENVNYKITRLEASTVNVYPIKTIFCSFMDTSSIYNPEILSIYNIDINSDNDLNLAGNGRIVPKSSNPGTYIINLTSDYCLSEYEHSVSVLENDSLTPVYVNICESENINADSTYEQYILYEQIQNTGTDMSNDLFLQQNFTNLLYNSQGCFSQDLIINTIKKQTLVPEYEYLCDRTRLKVNYKQISDTNSINTNQITDNLDTYTETDSMDITETSLVTFNVTDNFGCVTTDTFDIVVKKMEIRDIIYSVQESTCWDFGKMELTNSNIENGELPYTYILTNTINNNTLDDLSKVPEGVYHISVTDVRNCTGIFNKDIYVLRDCINEYPAFTPNNDGIEDDYFIPYTGYVEIFDRNGQLIRKLETPAYWDGKDKNNQPAPMGTYVAVTDQGKTVDITVIK